MRNHRFAEWLLARFHGRARASAIVGDLTETAQHQSRGWFWRACATVVFHASWRPLAGFLAMQATAYWLAQGNAIAFYGSPHPHSILEQVWVTTIGGLCVFNSFIVVYSGFRFGLRDPLTRTSLCALALGEAAVLLWWRQPAPHLILAAALCALTTALFFRRVRRSLSALVLIHFGQFAFSMAFVLLLAALFRHLPTHAPFPLIASTTFRMGGELLLASMCLLCTRVHDRVLASPLAA